MRMLAVFEKGERLRHIGHLDIMRAMQRALRRSGLPAAYSNGFNPHILLTFASALSTGASGARELMEVTLARDVTPEEFLAAMNRALPPEMQLSEARPLPERHPALMASVRAADYSLRIPDGAAREALAAAVPAYLARTEIVTERKTKSGVKPCDIGPAVLALEGTAEGLHAVLTLTESMTCKPDMLLRTLAETAGIEPPRMFVRRNALLGEDGEGRLAPLETL